MVVGFSADSQELVIEEGEFWCYTVQIVNGILSGSVSVSVHTENIEATGKAVEKYI